MRWIAYFIMHIDKVSYICYSVYIFSITIVNNGIRYVALKRYVVVIP
jgi:hypothetical protein